MASRIAGFRAEGTILDTDTEAWFLLAHLKQESATYTLKVRSGSPSNSIWPVKLGCWQLRMAMARERSGILCYDLDLLIWPTAPKRSPTPGLKDFTMSLTYRVRTGKSDFTDIRQNSYCAVKSTYLFGTFSYRILQAVPPHSCIQGQGHGGLALPPQPN